MAKDEAPVIPVAELSPKSNDNPTNTAFEPTEATGEFFVPKLGNPSPVEEDHDEAETSDDSDYSDDEDSPELKNDKMWQEVIKRINEIKKTVHKVREEKALNTTLSTVMNNDEVWEDQKPHYATPSMDRKVDEVWQEEVKRIKRDIRVLTFQGGGAKCGAYKKVIEDLENMGVLEQIDTVVGSSAGAIAAFLVACGLTAAQIQDELATVDLSDFIDDRPGIFRTAERLARAATTLGWHSPVSMEAWFKSLISNYTGDENITYKQFAARKNPDGTQCFKNLVITGTRVANQQTVFFSKDLNSETTLFDSLCISTRLPGLLPPVKGILTPMKFSKRKSDGMIVSTGGCFTRSEVGEGFVDGGLYANHPGPVFASTCENTGKPLTGRALLERRRALAKKMLCITLFVDDTHTKEVVVNSSSRIETLTSKHLRDAIVDSTSRSNEATPPYLAECTVVVKIPSHITTASVLTKDDNALLDQAGSAAMINYINDRVVRIKHKQAEQKGFEEKFQDWIEGFVQSTKARFHEVCDSSGFVRGFQLKCHHLLSSEGIKATLGKLMSHSPFTDIKYFCSANHAMVVDVAVDDAQVDLAEYFHTCFTDVMSKRAQTKGEALHMRRSPSNDSIDLPERTQKYFAPKVPRRS